MVARALECLIDRLPKSRRLARSRYGNNVKSALQRLLPERSNAEREAILRGVIRHRIANRAIFLAQTALPRLGAVAAALVPIDSSPGASSVLASETPVIIAAAHFGPLFFLVLALRRVVRDRPVIVVLRHEALYLRRIVPYLRRLGFEFVLDNEHSLRTLVRSMTARPRTVVMYAYDHTHDGRRQIPFLAGSVTTCNGIGFIADAGRASIVHALWKWTNGAARLSLTGPYCVDGTLPHRERREELLTRLYGILEARIVEAPEQWSGWEFVAPRIIAAGAGERDARLLQEPPQEIEWRAASSKRSTST